jgi:hypothetical protein
MKAIEKGSKSKLSVTVEPSLARAVEGQARRLGVPKSRIVTEADRALAFSLALRLAGES